METEVMYDTFPIKPLEHVMALRGLDCMKDSGRAAEEKPKSIYHK